MTEWKKFLNRVASEWEFLTKIALLHLKSKNFRKLQKAIIGSKNSCIFYGDITQKTIRRKVFKYEIVYTMNIKFKMYRSLLFKEIKFKDTVDFSTLLCITLLLLL